MQRRDTLLLACGTAEDRGTLRSIFEDSYNILEADNGSKMWLLLEQNHPRIAGVMLNVSLLEKPACGMRLPSGDRRRWCQIPAIVITEQDSPETTAAAFRAGAADVIPLQYDPYAMRQRVRNVVELYLYKYHPEDLAEQAVDLRCAYHALLKKMEHYEIILKQTENVLFEWDISTDTISFSDTWEVMFDFPPSTRDVRHRLAAGGFFHPDDLPLLLDRLRGLERGDSYQMAEVRVVKRNGNCLWCRFRATAIRNPDGTLQKICGIIINIDEEKRMERALQDRAERDALTKMLNKQISQKQAQEYLEQHAGKEPCALLIIDLDNFKFFNDQYGHLFGDTVLRQAAREIRKMFRAQDIVGRIGGDEFMILMRDVGSREVVERRCARLVAVLQNLFMGQETTCSLSCSIGVALSPEHGTTYVDLFRHADQALYQAKNLGRGRYVFYSGETAAFHA